MPDDEPRTSPSYRVCRMDDHGNTFVVREHLTRVDAERLAAEFTARGAQADLLD